MLHRDIFVLHGLGRLLGGVQGPVHILGHIDLVRLPAASGDLGQLVYFRLHRRQKAGHGHAHGGEQLGDKALLIGHQGKQQVLLLDLLLAILLGQALSALDGGEGFLRQLVHIHGRNLLGSGFRMDLKF